MGGTRRIHARLAPQRGAADLLHGLQDDAALQRSPLLAQITADMRARGAGAGEVANVVRCGVRRILAEAMEGASALISAHAARVITRCDGAGESHATVMRDLAISRAEFYRQLNAGRRGLALAAQRLTLAPTEPDLKMLDLRLRGAQVLAQTGRFDDAIAYLTPMLGGTGGLDLVRVACALGELHLEASRFRAARTFVSVARRAGVPLDGHAANLAAAKITFLECCIELKDTWHGNDWLTRDIGSLLARLQASAPPNDTTTLDAICELIQLLATRAGYLGQFERAETLLRSSPASDPAAPVAPATRAELLMRLASLRQLLPQSLDAGLANADELLRFASTHGLQRMVTAALAIRASIAGLRGDLPFATHLAGEAVDSSRAFFAPFDHASVCTMAASVALDAGRPNAARMYGREARRCARTGTFPHLLSRVFDANALQLEGRSDEALRALERVETAPAARPFSLLAGRAAYVKGRVYRARGEYRRALGAARDSIDILDRTGHRHALLQSFALATALAPDPRLQRRFEELRATL